MFLKSITFQCRLRWVIFNQKFSILLVIGWFPTNVNGWKPLGLSFPRWTSITPSYINNFHIHRWIQVLISKITVILGWLSQHVSTIAQWTWSSLVFADLHSLKVTWKFRLKIGLSWENQVLQILTEIQICKVWFWQCLVISLVWLIVFVFCPPSAATGALSSKTSQQKMNTSKYRWNWDGNTHKFINA